MSARLPGGVDAVLAMTGAMLVAMVACKPLSKTLAAPKALPP